MEFSIRPFRKEDAPSLAVFANNRNVSKNMNDAFPHQYKIENAEKFIAYATSHDPVQIFTIDINGRASGGIGLHTQMDVHKKNLELGYWLAEPFWGNGIISRAIPQIVNYGFDTFDVTRIFARPYGRNKASARVLEKCGFQLETHLKKTIYKWGEFEDELIYAVRKDEWKPGKFELIEI